MLATFFGSVTAPSAMEIALPALTAVVASCLVVIISLFRRGSEEDRIFTLMIALGGCILTFFALLQLHGRLGSAFAGELTADGLGIWTGLVATVATCMAMLTTLPHVGRYGAGWGESLGLMLMTLAGVLIVCMSGGLLSLFVGIEILSIAAYGLTGLTRFRGKSVEGALRYFILGAVASAFLLMGIAFAYGATGTTSLAALAPLPATDTIRYQGFELLAFGFLLVGLGFKIGAVPFHAWVPDAYEGAPTPLSGFMAATVKVAAFVALLRIVYTPLAAAHQDSIHAVLGMLAAATMVLGNLIALVQSNLKRMLAYSSVAHTGYMLLGVISPDGGPGAVVFYLAAYVPTVIGAFLVLVIIGRDREDLEQLDDLRGLARERPLVALTMTVFMLSFIGVPITGGFTAKLAIFSAAIGNGYWMLALLGIVMSVVSVAYYLNVVRLMYIPPAGHPWHTGDARYGMRVVLCAAVLLILVLGILPSDFLDGALEAAKPLAQVMLR